MAACKVQIFREADGRAPLLEWMDGLQHKARIKCRVRIERLGEMGNDLRRPEADYLREGIYELRISFQGLNYRILYFFHGRDAVVLSHGLAKLQRVPVADIEQAIARKARFELDPKKHTLEY